MNKISRKEFLTTTGAALTGLHALGYSSVLGANNTINLGIIGTGSRGNYIAQVVKQIPSLKLIACCDVREENLEEGLSHAASNAKGYSEYQKLLDNQEVDAVVIATPLHLHYTMARDALQVGKHVYCEKTMTYSIEEAQKLADLVNNSPATFQVGYQHRHNPLYQRIYEVISEGNIGPISYVECTWNRNGDWRRPVTDPSLERLINWRMYREYSQGLMAELCSHQIDIVNWILDEVPEKVSGFGGIDYWDDGRETYDNVHTVFEYPSGIKGKYSSITTNAHEGYSITFYGKKATIEIRDLSGHQAAIYAEQQPQSQEESDDADAITKPTNKAWQQGEAIPIKVKGQAGSDVGPTRMAFEHFVDCVLNDKQPQSNITNGHNSAICVLMGNSAMRNGTIETWKKEYAI
ncbi:Gfo/Idh/MocA family oxidoreductase [Aliifodinibius sp. S!AR15-10]|uniref:Gfo/Idh/MocA family protein n=1 Tax=Aliifodinibius sp. S!AR15-10 TaxID=2950437 RepID=UPI0028601941|nr:Gfo/Idh/MocA family oxidoreductase [Aliifodinibius sp. S!AR15-10]MDR8394610.1 Gfo/Idh/MocA family oxidoreductase [Aliifodinibius sp. S!AR15-10]